MTNQELVADWFAGKEITAVSMGGLGAGYENGIWEIAMTLLRELNGNPLDFDQIAQMQDNERDALRNSIDERPAMLDVYDLVQPSGAMVGAAWNIALVFHRHGYEAGLAQAPADRIIKITRMQ